MFRSKSLCFLLFFLLFFYCNAQLNNTWVIGYNASGTINPINSIYSIDFRNSMINYDTAVAKAFSFRSCDASISDSAGNLLFYTNGIAIMNAQNDTMVNGDSLSYSDEVYTTAVHSIGMIYPQTIMIIPAPDQPNIYYLIHQTYYLHPVFIYNEYCDSLFYSIVDMTQDSGRGAVIDKNHVLWTGNLFTNDLITIGSMSACKHANGRDWWIVTHKDSSNIFMKFLLTPLGLAGPYFQTINPIVNFTMMQACFSPDGTKFAYNNNSGVHLFNFDRCTGNFSNHKNLGLFTLPTYGSLGIVFSPNAQVLYASGDYVIYQWDLTASNIQSTKTTVCIYDSTYACPVYGVLFYQMQRAINGKVYISSPNSSYCLSVINNPDNLGTSCNAVAHGLSNLPYYNGASVPYFPNYNLGRLFASTCDTLTGIAQQQGNISKINITPNPNNGNFTITYPPPQNKSGTFQIYDVTGKVVFNYTLPQWSNEQSFLLAKLSDGVYNCVITSNGVRASKKIAVINE